ncbi:MAG TPA: response regulator [Flavobacteriales bacterium]|nr:response regulator [Flavobacteriales bacterium]
MSKLKVAILEDNKMLLKELKQNLDQSGLVEVAVWASDPEDLLQKVSKCSVEALILDIDISGSSMNGLDIAHKLQLPVLFASGKTKDFYAVIEDLNMNTENIVDHISKPITPEKLNKILPKFIKQIRLTNSFKFVYLDFAGSKRNKIAISDIVFLDSDKHFGAASNNKRIYFIDRPPETLVDFTFSKMEDIGFDKTLFVQTHKSYRLNIKKYRSYSNHFINVEVMNEQGKLEIKQIPVSVNFRKIIRELK